MLPRNNLGKPMHFCPAMLLPYSGRNLGFFEPDEFLMGDWWRKSHQQRQADRGSREDG